MPILNATTPLFAVVLALGPPREMTADLLGGVVLGAADRDDHFHRMCWFGRAQRGCPEWAVERPSLLSDVDVVAGLASTSVAVLTGPAGLGELD